MKDYNFTVNMNVDVPFYPSERHKKLRHLFQKEDFTVKLPDLDEKEFPIAARVKEMEKLVPDLGMSLDEFKNFDKSKPFWNNQEVYNFVRSKEKNDYYTKEIRCYNGDFYAAKRVEFFPHSFLTEVHHNADTVAHEITSYANNNYIEYNNDNSEYDKTKAIIDNDGYKESLAETEARIKPYYSRYVMFNGQLWEKCGEPSYEIKTSGWAHIGNGKDYAFMDIEYLSNEKIEDSSLENYKKNPNYISNNSFSALHKKEAFEKYKNVDAFWNRDSKFDRNYNVDCNIEVLMPEVFKFKDKIELEKMHQNSLSVKEVLKDIESFKAPEFYKPEEAYNFFTELVTTYYKGQHENKDIRIAANSVLKTLSENNSNLVCKYFADKGINTAQKFDKYWKELEDGILNKDKVISRERKSEEPEIGR